MRRRQKKSRKESKGSTAAAAADDEARVEELAVTLNMTEDKLWVRQHKDKKGTTSM